MTRHTIDEALDTFDLIAGPGSEADKKACAMTLLAWVNGDEWSDAMSCAHPVIRQNVIGANDETTTTAADRAELVRLGEHGVIDTWWIPTEVVAYAFGQVPREETATLLERTLLALKYIGEWKATKERPNLRDANLGGANLGGANLGGANLRGAYLRDANLDNTKGNAYTTLPIGYELTDAGLIVRSE